MPPGKVVTCRSAYDSLSLSNYTQTCDLWFKAIQADNDPQGSTFVSCQTKAKDFFVCSRPSCHARRKSPYSRVFPPMVFTNCFFSKNYATRLSTVWPSVFLIQNDQLYVTQGTGIDSRGKKININDNVQCPWNPKTGANTMRPVCQFCNPST
ncbi:hypothetical protein O181_004623 [Austropuccinia psidii MF-1]|uniref:Uncharacterized protein n=1 Tax=Austropuccinia psidii MF-1 TaxID=1389203 RepID=A0A9Q3BGY8_9BASI|nr:hypothetical protein [Austropuccinia psidii MF-1]